MSWACCSSSSLHDFLTLTIEDFVNNQTGDEDHIGAGAVLDDLFDVVTRTFVTTGWCQPTKYWTQSLEGALSVDPLDPDNWWELTSQEGGEAFVIVSKMDGRSKSEYFVLKKNERYSWDMKMNISS